MPKVGRLPGNCKVKLLATLATLIVRFLPLLSSSPPVFKFAPEVPAIQLTLVAAFMVPPVMVDPLSSVVNTPVVKVAVVPLVVVPVKEVNVPVVPTIVVPVKEVNVPVVAANELAV